MAIDGGRSKISGWGGWVGGGGASASTNQFFILIFFILIGSSNRRNFVRELQLLSNRQSGVKTLITKLSRRKTAFSKPRTRRSEEDSSMLKTDEKTAEPSPLIPEFFL